MIEINIKVKDEVCNSNLSFDDITVNDCALLNFELDRLKKELIEKKFDSEKVMAFREEYDK